MTNGNDKGALGGKINMHLVAIMFLDTNGLSQHRLSFCARSGSHPVFLQKMRTLRSVSLGNWNSCGNASEEAFVISYEGQREKLWSPHRFQPHPTRFFSEWTPLMHGTKRVLWQSCHQRTAAMFLILLNTAEYWASEKGISSEKMGRPLNTWIGNPVS